jgi:hypothetical protein
MLEARKRPPTLVITVEAWTQDLGGGRRDHGGSSERRYEAATRASGRTKTGENKEKG